MAFLDVSDVLLDPDFTDTFIVNRRVEVVSSATGRSATTVFKKPTFGVVTATGSDDLSRLQDADVFKRSITIVTKFKLRGEVEDNAKTNWKPDLITWRGDNFIVKVIDLYPQFGAGFVQAICSSEDLVDQPPAETSLQFDNRVNSSYLGVI